MIEFSIAGKHRGKTVAPLPDAFGHPTLCLFQRPLAKRLHVHRLDQLEGAIGAEEKIPPSQEPLITRRA